MQIGLGLGEGLQCLGIVQISGLSICLGLKLVLTFDHKSLGKSQSVHKIDKSIAPNCSLCLINSKTQLLVPQLK